MIKITKLTLKNFLSVGNVTQAIKLDNSGLTLVLGSNTDSSGGTTRNGAGKTSILQAISYAIYGKPLTKIKIPNLVNNINPKGMLVTLEFERDNRTYRIERGQKPGVMKFYVNNAEIKEEGDEAQGENRHTNAEIERLIGMSHTMFKHIVALNTFTEPFLKLAVSEQRAVIEELLGVTQISQRAELLKKTINGPDGTKELIRYQEANIKATTETNNRIENAIVQTQSKSDGWLRTHESRLASLSEEIQSVENIDYDMEITLFDKLDAHVGTQKDLEHKLSASTSEMFRLNRDKDSFLAEVKRADSELLGLDLDTHLRRVRNEIDRKQQDADRHDAQAKKFGDELAQIEFDLNNSDAHTCRTCGQGLSGTNHLQTVLDNLAREKNSVEKKIERERKEADDRRSEIAALLIEITDITASIAEQRTSVSARRDAAHLRSEEGHDTITTLEREIEKLRHGVEQLGRKPEPIFKTRDELYRAKQMYELLIRDLEGEMQQANPFASQIDSLQSTLQPIDYEPLNELNLLLKHQDFLLRLLTSKDSFIRKRIIDQNLAFLNSRLNQYLDKLGLPHEVRFVSDLSVEITLLGRDFDFEQLSRGEQGRVIMATSWSFRDVWESLNNSLNLLWVDELIDNGLDDQGAEAALEILKKMARDRGRNVFLISHKDNLQGRVSRIMMVHKENSFTRFEDDIGV